MINKYTVSITKLITFGFNIEDRLPEWISYHLNVANFSTIIVVECFHTLEEYTDNSKMKRICSCFPEDRVIYDFVFIGVKLPTEDQRLTHEFWHDHIRPHNAFAASRRSPFTDNQLYVTQRWIERIRDDVAESNHSNTWVGYTDVDEFINTNGVNISDLIDSHGNDHSGFGFMQQLYGHNSVNKHNVGDLITQTHTKSVKFSKDGGPHQWAAAPDSKVYNMDFPPEMGDIGFKSMYRLSDISSMSCGWVHHIEYGIGNRNGKLVRWRLRKDDPIHLNKYTFHEDVAHIDHYRFKDIESVEFVDGNMGNSISRKALCDALESSARPGNSNIHKHSRQIVNGPGYKESIDILKKL